MATLAPEHYPEYPDASAAAEGSLPLRELLTILRRRRPVIFWVVILLTGVAALTGLQVTPTSPQTFFSLGFARKNAGAAVLLPV
jgi:uncharacterized protein involved in exopolysaccharide biosynthesis